MNFDAPAKYGGEDTAPTPMETVLASLAECTSFDVVSILKKKRQNISGYFVETKAERAVEPPEFFTKIHIKYILKGKSISKEAVESNPTLIRQITVRSERCLRKQQKSQPLTR